MSEGQWSNPWVHLAASDAPWECKATRRRPPGAVNVGGSVTLRVVRRLSIRPPLLSICPPVLSIFDARLVADAGGENVQAAVAAKVSRSARAIR